MLSLKLLGGASIERSGTQVSGRAARGQRLALLALLATGRVLTRDRLLALLWPESDAERGRRMLSDTLYLVRSALGEEVVVGAGDEIRLNPDRVTCDVTDFERLTDAGELAAAAALYSGPFLDGFHLTDSSEFEQWVDGERARLEARFASALEGLAEASEGRKESGTAAGWWRRRAALDPGNGRVALRLMRALDAAGDRAGALQHARVHAALLRAEYDAEPDPEMLALTERLRREPAARGAVPAPAPTPAVADPPAAEIPVAVAATAADTVAAPARRQPGRRTAAVALAGAAMLIAGIAIFRAVRDDAVLAPSAAARRSIAVLPFDNLSADRSNDYFSDGLTEELISALSRIEGLRVAARTSSFAVGGGSLDVRAIGDTLGVATVLEGSVRRDGGRLRVSARLADAETGYQIWTDDYDRRLADIFAVQDEIARAIAGALELRLTPGAADAAVRRPSTLEAHDLYLRGVHVRNQLTSDALTKAVDFFDRAIQIDSGYALAYAGKVSAIAPLVWYRHLPRAQGLLAIRTAAHRAVALDASLGEGRVAKGILAFYFEWDWAEAEREFRRAVELNPSDPHAHHMFANYLMAMGRLDEAIAQRRRALELDPLSNRSGTLLGRDLYAAGRYAEAIEQLLRVAELDSTSPLALGTGQEGSFGLPDVYDRLGRHDEAIEQYLRLARLEGIPPVHLARFRTAYAENGMTGYWQARLAYETEQAGTTPDPLRMAALAARAGDAEVTASWLERAYEERSLALPFLGVLPAYDGVRAHPRIAAILVRMKLAEAAERASAHRASGPA